jgi:hypothetical protein
MLSDTPKIDSEGTGRNGRMLQMPFPTVPAYTVIGGPGTIGPGATATETAGSARSVQIVSADRSISVAAGVPPDVIVATNSVDDGESSARLATRCASALPSGCHVSPESVLLYTTVPAAPYITAGAMGSITSMVSSGAPAIV